MGNKKDAKKSSRKNNRPNRPLKRIGGGKKAPAPTPPEASPLQQAVAIVNQAIELANRKLELSLDESAQLAMARTMIFGERGPLSAARLQQMADEETAQHDEAQSADTA